MLFFRVGLPIVGQVDRYGTSHHICQRVLWLPGEGVVGEAGVGDELRWVAEAPLGYLHRYWSS